MRLDLLAWTAAAALVAIPATAQAAVDSFIWFEGEQGNSTDAQHKGWFEIRELSLNMANQGTVDNATGRAGSTRGQPREFTVRRASDSASATFFRQALTSGRHFKLVKIELRKAGGDPHPYVNYEFTNVMISKVQMGGSGDKGPEESITFVYGGVTVHYAPSDKTAPDSTRTLATPVHK